jgi:hypothetical protein
VELSHLEVPEPDVNNSGRWCLGQDPGGEVRVFRHDRKTFSLRMKPDLSVRPLVVQVAYVNVFGAAPEIEVVGQVYVDQITGHEGQAILLIM